MALIYDVEGEASKMCEYCEMFRCTFGQLVRGKRSLLIHFWRAFTQSDSS